MSLTIEFSIEQISHSRTVYSFFDALGTYGGLASVVYAFFYFLFGPLAEHNFEI